MSMTESGLSVRSLLTEEELHALGAEAVARLERMAEKLGQRKNRGPRPAAKSVRPRPAVVREDRQADPYFNPGNRD
jgi:hypothetical protein